jgi:hypothetical protein
LNMLAPDMRIFNTDKQVKVGSARMTP